MKLNYILAFLSIFVFVALLTPAAAEVYKRVDSKGNVYYSTTPAADNQAPADLPKIHRENISEKINNIKSLTPPNCVKHDGVDCAKGPDKSDGSVICANGFRDAVLNYDSYCGAVKLEVQFLIEFEKQPSPLLHSTVFKGDRKLDPRYPSALQISIRNLSAVDADLVNVSVKIPGLRKAIAAAGPDKIDSFGISEYRIDLDALEKKPLPHQLARSSVKVSCENCSALRHVR